MDTSVSLVTAAAGIAADGIYLGWGPFTIQLGNLLVIVAMIVLFVAAILLPFPGGRKRK